MGHEYQFGVLFVHGIGSQRRGATLDGFGSPLRSWLDEWLRPASAPEAGSTPRPVAEFTAADLAPKDGEPSNADLTLRTADGEHRWLLAESWWAQEFEPPTFGELLSWAVDILGWTAFAHMGTRVRRALRLQRAGGGLASRLRTIPRLLVEFVLFVATALVAPFFLVLLVLTLLLSIVPIHRVRALVGRLQRLLAASVGDSLVLLERPLQAAAIVGRIRRDLAWLADRCQKVAVVGHSQGALVAHEAVRRQPPPEFRLLVTFGSGLNKLSEIRWIRSRSLLDRLRPWALTLGLMLVGLTLPWVVGDLHWIALAVALYAVPMTVVITLASRRGKSSAGKDRGNVLRIRLLVAVALAGLFAGLAMLFLIADSLAPLTVVGFSLASIGGFAVVTGRPITGAWAREEFALPTGAWVDLYSSDDPVPNGPLLDDGLDQLMTHDEVHNYASVLRDHTGYWRNRDQFVARVARCLAAEDGLDLTAVRERDAERLDVAWERRRWRVGWLGVGRVIALIGTLVLLLRHWGALPRIGQEVAERTAALVDQVPGVAFELGALAIWQARSATFVLLITAVAAAWWVAQLAWRIWDRRDASMLVNRRDFELADPGMLGYLVLLAVGAQIVAFAASGWLAEAARGLATAMVAGGTVALLVSLIVWLERLVRHREFESPFITATAKTWVVSAVLLLPAATAGRAWHPDATPTEQLLSGWPWLVPATLLALAAAALVVVGAAPKVVRRLRAWAHAEPVAVAHVRSAPPEQRVSLVERRVRELRQVLEEPDLTAQTVAFADEVAALADAAREQVPDELLTQAAKYSGEAALIAGERLEPSEELRQLLEGLQSKGAFPVRRAASRQMKRAPS